MKIFEYRTICPISVEKYKIGSVYMTAKRSEEETKQVKGEGIETIKLEPFKNEKESGIYTYKIMHFKSRIPAFMRWALPDKYCHCHEQSWNAYPHYYTSYAVPGMGEDFVMIVDSYHIPYKKGEPIPDNLLNLSEEELSMRKIVYLDILEGKPVPDKNRDLKEWTNPELNINEPLRSLPDAKKDETEPPSWIENFDGEMMVAVKVVKFKFHWRGLQTIVENFATNSFYHNLFNDNHRAMFRWSDDWAKMTIEDVIEFETKIYNQNNSLDFERDDSKPMIDPPNEKPLDCPSEPNSSEENANY